MLAGLILLASAAEDADGRPRCAGKKATIVGSSGSETLRSKGRRSDVIAARGGDDVILAGGGRDVVCAGPGDDLVHGGKGRDVLRGWTGFDTLFGNTGSDKQFGEADDDTLIGGPGGELAAGGLGNDRVYGQQQDDLLIGSDGDDTLIGDHGNDEMRGDAGNDWLRGDANSNILNGGPGDDWVSFAAYTSFGKEEGVPFSLRDGSLGPETDDDVSGVENVAGSAFADELHGFVPGATARGLGYRPNPDDPRPAFVDECTGFLAASCGPHPVPVGQPVMLMDPAPADPGVQVLGGAGGDRLQVSRAGPNVIATASSALAAGPGCAGGGTTMVVCPVGERPGYVVVYGDAGPDSISVVGDLGPATTVRLDGGEGGDSILGGPGDETLEAGYDDASVDTPGSGHHTPDFLDGGGGDDVVSSLYFGPDLLQGGAGSDQMVSDACTGNVVDGGSGGSDIAGFAKDFSVTARIGGLASSAALAPEEGVCVPARVAASNEILEGTRGDDVLIGNNRSNSLIIGHQGNDVVKRLGGRDRLRGDAGSDVLEGGPGPDVLEAADGEADRSLHCGSGGRRAHRDAHDPRPRRCR
ncbi:MAG: calcium-binding protein [Solirubrobacterales bacterium]